jgi:hypothetical protein
VPVISISTHLALRSACKTNKRRRSRPTSDLMSSFSHEPKRASSCGSIAACICKHQPNRTKKRVFPACGCQYKQDQLNTVDSLCAIAWTSTNMIFKHQGGSLYARNDHPPSLGPSTVSLHVNNLNLCELVQGALALLHPYSRLFCTANGNVNWQFQVLVNPDGSGLYSTCHVIRLRFVR